MGTGKGITYIVIYNKFTDVVFVVLCSIIENTIIIVIFNYTIICKCNSYMTMRMVIEILHRRGGVIFCFVPKTYKIHPVVLKIELQTVNG